MSIPYEIVSWQSIPGLELPGPGGRGKWERERLTKGMIKIPKKMLSQ